MLKDNVYLQGACKGVWCHCARLSRRPWCWWSGPPSSSRCRSAWTSHLCSAASRSYRCSPTGTRRDEPKLWTDGDRLRPAMWLIREDKGIVCQQDVATERSVQLCFHFWVIHRDVRESLQGEIRTRSNHQVFWRNLLLFSFFFLALFILRSF